MKESPMALHQGRAQLFPVTEGITFLGFRVFLTHRRLKRAEGVTFEHRRSADFREAADSDYLIYRSRAGRNTQSPATLIRGLLRICGSSVCGHNSPRPAGNAVRRRSHTAGGRGPKESGASSLPR